MANQIELQFASNFNDFKEMSTMVRITGGASCNDVGLSHDDCITERTTATHYQTKLKKPGVRTSMF